MNKKLQIELLDKAQSITMDLIQVHIELLNSIDEKPNFMNLLGNITDSAHSLLTDILNHKH